jgi:hypothetical protein
MGEALLVKAGTGLEKNPLDNVSTGESYHALLVKTIDSSGNILPNIPVHCNDGGNWYNYNTNENGYTLFHCNSGAANITVWNYSILDSYNIADQLPNTYNIDLPIGIKSFINISTIKAANAFINNNISIRILDTNSMKVEIVGGGGHGGNGAGYNNGNTSSSSGVGGGGGAYNTTTFYPDRLKTYNITIGYGGYFEQTENDGSYYVNYYNTGGTTSAFDISAVGGRGGEDGIGIGGNPSAYSNSDFNFGGGGGGGAYTLTLYTRIYNGGNGVNGGGNGGFVNFWNSGSYNLWSLKGGFDGVNGGGGGGGAGGICWTLIYTNNYKKTSYSWSEGGAGGNGLCLLTFIN